MIKCTNIISKVENMMKLAFKELDKLKEKYLKFYSKIKFEEDKLAEVNLIIKEQVFFDKPQFTKLEGTLTKNLYTRSYNKYLILRKVNYPVPEK